MEPSTSRTQAAADEIARLAPLIADWSRRRPVAVAVLFGSRARGLHGPESDVDLAAWTRPLPAPRERLAWHRELSRALDSPVHLVFVTPRLEPVLGFQIAREGVPVHEAEPGAWARERLRLWHLYQDSLPFRRLSRRRLSRFIEEARHAS